MTTGIYVREKSLEPLKMDKEIKKKEVKKFQ